MTHQLQSIIELAWENRASLTPENSPEIREAVEHVIVKQNLRTRDLGGTVSTQEFGDAVAKRVA